jgi:large subunit ribosomal protein L1
MRSIDEVLQAVREVKRQSGGRKFKQSIDLVINLQDVDVKKPENKIDDVVDLPNPPGKNAKVCVFASKGVALQAKRANADLVLGKADIEKLAADKREAKKLAHKYHFFLAEGPIIPLVGKKLGFALGPRGKMPKPIPHGASIEEEIERCKRSVRIRTRDQPVVQCKIGEEDMPDKALAENVEAVLKKLGSRLERGMRNVRDVRLKTTMGKPIRVRITP